MGQKEVHEAVREARQAGVIVIAIAFGSEQEMARNKNVYKEMYQNGIIMVRPDEIHKYLSKTIQTEINK
jgi:nitric oxide reductase activation protein